MSSAMNATGTLEARFRITLDCYTANSAKGTPKPATGNWKWVACDELESFALSTTGRKLARLLERQAAKA